MKFAAMGLDGAVQWEVGVNELRAWDGARERGKNEGKSMLGIKKCRRNCMKSFLRFHCS